MKSQNMIFLNKALTGYGTKNLLYNCILVSCSTIIKIKALVYGCYINNKPYYPFLNWPESVCMGAGEGVVGNIRNFQIIFAFH